MGIARRRIRVKLDASLRVFYVANERRKGTLHRTRPCTQQEQKQEPVIRRIAMGINLERQEIDRLDLCAAVTLNHNKSETT